MDLKPKPYVVSVVWRKMPIRSGSEDPETEKKLNRQEPAGGEPGIYVHHRGFTPASRGLGRPTQYGNIRGAGRHPPTPLTMSFPRFLGAY